MSAVVTSNSLKRSEAEARAALISVREYDVALDLSESDSEFFSVSIIRFSSGAGTTFVDVKALSVGSIYLDGASIDPETVGGGRLPLSLSAGEHELRVGATMAFRNDGEGLHRSIDPTDGEHYVYAMSFMDAAPSIYACFDQPDMKAPYVLHVKAPAGWVVRANAAEAESFPEEGEWDFERSEPLATYFFTLVAGPYHVITDHHDGIDLGLLSRTSLAPHLDAQAEDILTVTKQSFDEFHRLFGSRYAFGTKYDQAFVPEFNAGAMENPGLVTYRDPMIFTSRVTRGALINRATTIAHEMAHQWFGNLVTPQWWDDLWLNESFAEYLGNRVAAQATQYDDTWVATSYARRQWGLMADQAPSTHPVAGNGAEDAVVALQNFDGISYTKGSSVLKQLATSYGDEVFFRGVRDHFERHRYGNATLDDLIGSWERAGSLDLSTLRNEWLLTAGADEIAFDRESQTISRAAPPAHPAERSHALTVAIGRRGSAENGGTWTTQTLTLDGDPLTLEVGSKDAVIFDPYDESWAVAVPDQMTIRTLVHLLPTVTDDHLRAGIWNNIRSGYQTGRVDPADVIDLACAALPVHDAEDGPRRLRGWLLGRVLPLAPEDSRTRLESAAQSVLDGAAAGSEEQLSALRTLVSVAPDTELLRQLLNCQPDGIELDRALRWRIMSSLAERGGTDRAELEAIFAADPAGDAKAAMTHALCSLPDPKEKAWAWSVFVGESDVPNYEIEAAGSGLWRGGVNAYNAEYVERYFADLAGTAQHRSGWVLGDSASAFFPAGAVSAESLALADSLLASGSLSGPLHRRLTDDADTMRRQLQTRTNFPH